MQEMEALSESLLKERAKQYTAESHSDRGRLLGHLLMFRLENQWFGLTTSQVRQITRLEDGVVLPRSKPMLLGLVNQRGVFIPLIDLCQILHLPPQRLKEDRSQKLILMAGEQGDYTFLVEELYTVEPVYESYLLSQSDSTQEKASQLVKSLLEIPIQKKSRRVIWLKEEVLEKIVEKAF